MAKSEINVKGENKISDAKRREKLSVTSGVLGIVLNVLLCGVKFAVGFLTNSISITADAVNNLSDAGTNVVTIVGAKLSNKPVDKEHPFGHGRIEYVSALVVALVIILMGFELGESSVEKIITPEEVTFSLTYVIVLILAIVVKLVMAIYNRHFYKLSQNINLKAAAQDSINDCLATTATIVALVVSAYTNIKVVDGIIGVIVAIFVLISGIKIVKDVISVLLGKAPDPELVKSIEEIILSEEQIVGVHDLIIHDYGPGRVFASAHAEVPCNIDVMRLHEMIDTAEKRIQARLGITISIHMDPVVIDDEKIEGYKSLLTEILKDYDEEFSFHDFRVIEGRTHVNFVFDLMIPFRYQKSKNTIAEELKEIVAKEHPEINLIMKVEHSYT